MPRDMHKVMDEELHKIRNYPRWHFHGFVPRERIEIERRNLRLSGMKFRTEKVYDNGGLVGFNVFVLS